MAKEVKKKPKPAPSAKKTPMRKPSRSVGPRTASKEVDLLERLTDRVQHLEKLQEDQFLLVMKFSVVRSIHIITMLLEQSSAPPRYIAQAVEMANEATQKIVRSKDLDEVRKLDIELQNQLRNVIGAFAKQ